MYGVKLQWTELDTLIAYVKYQFIFISIIFIYTLTRLEIYK